MFGPPFGGMGGFGAMGMNGFDPMEFAAMPPRHRPGGRIPQPVFEVRAPGFNMPIANPAFQPFPMGAAPFGVPGMMAGPMPGIQNRHGGLPRPRMPRAEGAGVGRVFDPSRAERRQPAGKKQGRYDHARAQPRAKYEKIKALTPGGMSESISIIRSNDDGKLYIEKRVRTDGVCLKRAQAEVKALKAVRGHPNLNKLIEYEVRANGLCSIIVEYCDGESLDQRIVELQSRGGHFDEAGIWHVLFSVAKALAFLHTGIKDIERDEPNPEWDTIAHLDLKPQNIFLSSERKENGQRRVLLADFGCAVTLSDRQNGRENERAQPCGTPGWYPPEGMAGQVYGTKTDIWMLDGTIQALCLLLKCPHRPALASSSPCGHRYSSALQGMVKELTNERFDKRPSARRIAIAAAPQVGVNLRR